MSAATRYRRSGGFSYRSYRRMRAILLAHAIANAARCPECGMPMRAEHALHVDHIVALSRGGTNHPSNLRVLHRRCNLRKGTKPAGMPKSDRPKRTRRSW
jgi:5-methylcytosine-specific restriction endonuclease McrA